MYIYIHIHNTCIYICIHHANLGCHKLIQTKLLMQSDTADIYSSDCGFPAYVTHTHHETPDKAFDHLRYEAKRLELQHSLSLV